jgi:branched-chain amino acid transport system permease protein
MPSVRESALQIFANGLIDGLNIGLLALAFTVVYYPTRVFHLALAALSLLAAFVAWTGARLGFPLLLAAAVAVLLSSALSAACEIFNHGPLERRRVSDASHLVSSLGIYIALTTALVMIWGNEPKVLRTGVDSSVTLGGMVLTSAQLLSAAVSILSLGVFYTWLRLSDSGLRFRALADNPTETGLRGHDVGMLRLQAFSIGGALAAVAMLMRAYDIGFDPHGGLTTLLLAVVAMIVGGRRTFVGPVVGGLLLGLLRCVVTWFLASRWEGVVTFLLLGVFLLVRPNGLIQNRGRLEADA